MRLPTALARAGRHPAALAAFVIAAALVPFARAWIHGLTVLHRDQIGQFLPLRWLVGTALREGRLPLWNPFCATGMPLLAETTHGVLHPLSVAAAFLFPSDGLDPLVGLYVASAALGATALSRALGASWGASAVAGLAYALAGYTLSMTSNLVGIAGAGTGPWVVAGLRLAGRDRTPHAFAAGGLGLAAGALSGDIPGVTVTAAIGLVLAVDAGGWRGGARAAGAAAVGGLVAGIQLVPSWAFLQETHRALALPEWDAHQWDLAPWRLVEWIAPGFFIAPEDGVSVAPVFMALGHPTRFRIPFAESVFLGVATLLLAGASLRAGRTARVLAVVTAVVIWLAFGHHFGARILLDLVPVVRGFRYGEKYLAPVALCVSALAAAGAERLVRDVLAARRYATAAAIVAIVLAGAWLIVASGAPSSLLLPPGDPAAEPFRAHLLRGLPHALLAALGLAGALAVAARGQARPALAAIVAVVWAAGVAAAPYGLRPGSVDARLHATPPPLEAEAPGPRVLNLRGAPIRPPRAGWNAADQLIFDVRASLGPNTNALHRIDSYGVDTGLFPIRWFRVTSSFGDDLPAVARRHGVTHLVFPSPRTEAGREIAAKATAGGRSLGADARTGMELWEVPHRPWAAFAASVVPAADLDGALHALRAMHASGDGAVVVEGEAVAGAPGRVLSVVRHLERLEIVAETEADGTLVVGDAYWPGWRAFVDGRETSIHAADGLVRAVAWPAGRHTLAMRYDPPEIGVGAWLSAAGLVALGIGCLVLRRGTTRRRAAAELGVSGRSADPEAPGARDGAA